MNRAEVRLVQPVHKFPPAAHKAAFLLSPIDKYGWHRNLILSSNRLAEACGKTSRQDHAACI